jgi:hypothetical protein
MLLVGDSVGTFLLREGAQLEVMEESPLLKEAFSSFSQNQLYFIYLTPLSPKANVIDMYFGKMHT